MCVKGGIIYRAFSTNVKSIKYYTTPIYYVNAQPHIGHLYSSVIADAIQRWQQLKGSGKIEFSTGTDEHGIKIQQAANKNKITLPEYCGNISKKYTSLCNSFNVQYTTFIRTSNEDHKRVVKHFWNLLNKNGYIYKAKYEGWYCVSDETFLTETQLKEHSDSADGEKRFVSIESGHPVEWTQEENYMFKLSSFQSDLIHWLTTNEKFVRPQKFHKILLDMIRNEPLPDLSVSRPSQRVHWGIRVPEDESQTIYVWLDALVNYLTVAGYSKTPGAQFTSIWPPDVQVIGKDILKFHGIYWPAFLMAANLEPPETLLCHSHWTVDGEKMSKSKNNVVCPFNRSEIYTSEGLRYFLLREGVAHSDGNYSDSKVVSILNAELADTLGNLLSRCCGSILNPGQVFPAIEPTVFESLSRHDVTQKLIENLTCLPDTCEQHYEDFNFYKVVDTTIATLHSANKFFETLKPWELRRRADDAALKELHVILHVTMECLRVVAILLQPIIPELTDHLLNKLNVPNNQRSYRNSKELGWKSAERQLSPDSAVIFKRIQITPEGKKVKQNKRS